LRIVCLLLARTPARLSLTTRAMRHRPKRRRQKLPLKLAADAADQPGADRFGRVRAKLDRDRAKEGIAHRRIDRRGERHDDFEFGIGQRQRRHTSSLGEGELRAAAYAGADPGHKSAWGIQWGIGGAIYVNGVGRKGDADFADGEFTDPDDNAIARGKVAAPMTAILTAEVWQLIGIAL
jgi:hypothetical protein